MISEGIGGKSGNTGQETEQSRKQGKFAGNQEIRRLTISVIH
jgi:hypothetical protein